MKVNLPLTKDQVGNFAIGDVMELTGHIYTARDAAHKRFGEAAKRKVIVAIDTAGRVLHDEERKKYRIPDR